MRSLFKSDDGRDPFAATLIKELLAQGIRPEDIAAKMDTVLPESITAAGRHVLQRLKTEAPAMLADRREIRQGFQQRQREKWGNSLDLLTMLIEATRESGEEYRRDFGKAADADRDFIFNSLLRLHGRACLLASETHWLMEGGYASGAMARWRTLHEIAVVSYFLRANDQDTAERYFYHHIVESHRAAKQYQEHCGDLGHDPLPEKVINNLRTQHDQLLQRFGDEYKLDWGWAAAALQRPRVTFAEIEQAVSMQRFRPYFKLSCHSNHAGSKGLHYDLGKALVPDGKDLMLAGPSDAGIQEPGMCTALSLLQVTATFLTCRARPIMCLVVLESLRLLAEEAAESFAMEAAKLEDAVGESARR